MLTFAQFISEDITPDKVHYIVTGVDANNQKIKVRFDKTDIADTLAWAKAYDVYFKLKSGTFWLIQTDVHGRQLKSVVRQKSLKNGGWSK
jgi:hypothetical protein